MSSYYVFSGRQWASVHFKSAVGTNWRSKNLQYRLRNTSSLHHSGAVWTLTTQTELEAHFGLNPCCNSADTPMFNQLFRPGGVKIFPLQTNKNQDRFWFRSALNQNVLEDSGTQCPDLKTTYLKPR